MRARFNCACQRGSIRTNCVVYALEPRSAYWGRLERANSTKYVLGFIPIFRMVFVELLLFHEILNMREILVLRY